MKHLGSPLNVDMKNKKRIEIGEFGPIVNKSARPGAKASYMYGVVKEQLRGEWRDRHLMLTSHEYEKATSRAAKNPEDCEYTHIVVSRPKKRGFMAWLKRER
jgi:hypothetical protein